MLAIGISPAFSMLAQAQQEMDPDHYDQAPAQANRDLKAQSNHKVASANHRAHSNVRMASKHTVRANHHRSHVSA
jgi:hypothetical protein